MSVTAFGKLGELAAKFLKKRSRVLVFGTPSARVYTNKAGEVVASLDLVADDFEFLDSGTDGSQGQAFTPSDTDVPF